MTIQKLAASALATTAAALLLATPAHAVLQDRDIDGNGQVDAYYDSDLNVTWLREIQQVNNVQGLTWSEAMNFANGYSIGSYADWRLPTNTVECYGANCTGSEMGHWYYTELGNSAYAGPGASFGNFQNAFNNGMTFWTSTDNSLANTHAWLFETYYGLSQYADKTAHNGGGVLLVRDGDVMTAAVPEPETYAMLLAGMGVLATMVRRRKA